MHTRSSNQPYPQSQCPSPNPVSLIFLCNSINFLQTKDHGKCAHRTNHKHQTSSHTIQTRQIVPLNKQNHTPKTMNIITHESSQRRSREPETKKSQTAASSTKPSASDRQIRPQYKASNKFHRVVSSTQFHTEFKFPRGDTQYLQYHHTVDVSDSRPLQYGTPDHLKCS